MRIPHNPFDLVVPQKPDFRVAGWELVFGRFQWFYVVGGQQLLAKAGLSDHSTPKKRAGQVAVPPSWKAHCPSLDWDSVAENQIDRAIGTKPQRFDKALLSVLAIIEAVNQNSKTDYLKSIADDELVKIIQIKPATYEIDEFDSKKLSGFDKSLKKRLLLAGKQMKPAFLDEIAKGHGATYPTLSAMIEHLDGVVVRPKISRNSGALRPARSETVVLS